MVKLSPSTASGENSDVGKSHELSRLLQNPKAYIDRTASVEVVETHISWVFLTDRFAYKLKKPVQFDFLDFSTLERRRIDCGHEVDLNRRLAPGVYLGVVPVARASNGAIAVGGDGTVVDWLVKMKRLSADKALDVLIREKQVSTFQIDQLAKVLSKFYEALPPVTLTVEDYRQSIERHVVANRLELAARSHHLDSRSVQRTHSAQLAALRLLPEVFDERVCNGRIVEGHGDLRPEHIYFNPTPLVIDCIEFNREFRTLDVVDELAFLEMECDLLGARGVIEPVFDRYFQQSGDSPLEVVIDFYRAYRASVRAKVSALRAEQLTGDDRNNYLDLATNYLSLADRYSRRMVKPMIVLVRGLPGVGKSTLAESISDDLGFELLQTDVVRRSLFGEGGHVSYNEGSYRPENRLQVYDQMHKAAERLLEEGASVVLDGTYLSADLRAKAAEIAAHNEAEFLSLHCQCSEELALQRISDRLEEGMSLSETRPEFFAQQRQAEEPDPPNLKSLVVDTSSTTGEQLDSAFSAIRNQCFGAAIRS